MDDDILDLMSSRMSLQHIQRTQSANNKGEIEADGPIDIQTNAPQFRSQMTDYTRGLIEACNHESGTTDSAENGEDDSNFAVSPQADVGTSETRHWGGESQHTDQMNGSSGSNSGIRGNLPPDLMDILQLLRNESNVSLHVSVNVSPAPMAAGVAQSLSSSVVRRNELASEALEEWRRDDDNPKVAVASCDTTTAPFDGDHTVEEETDESRGVRNGAVLQWKEYSDQFAVAEFYLVDKQLSRIDFSDHLDYETGIGNDIQEVYLRGNQITDASALELPRYFPQLRALDLGDNQIGPLLTLESLPLSLICLDLRSNRIKEIPGVMSCIHLRELNLSNNLIESLVALPPTLQRLDVTDNLIWSHRGLRALGMCAQLSDVSIWGNPVTVIAPNYKTVLRSIAPNLKFTDAQQSASVSLAVRREATQRSKASPQPAAPPLLPKRRIAETVARLSEPRRPAKPQVKVQRQSYEDWIEKERSRQKQQGEYVQQTHRSFSPPARARSPRLPNESQISAISLRTRNSISSQQSDLVDDRKTRSSRSPATVRSIEITRQTVSKPNKSSRKSRKNGASHDNATRASLSSSILQLSSVQSPAFPAPPIKISKSRNLMRRSAPIDAGQCVPDSPAKSSAVSVHAIRRKPALSMSPPRSHRNRTKQTSTSRQKYHENSESPRVGEAMIRDSNDENSMIINTSQKANCRQSDGRALRYNVNHSSIDLDSITPLPLPQSTQVANPFTAAVQQRRHAAPITPPAVEEALKTLPYNSALRRAAEDAQSKLGDIMILFQRLTGVMHGNSAPMQEGKWSSTSKLGIAGEAIASFYDCAAAPGDPQSIVSDWCGMVAALDVLVNDSIRDAASIVSTGISSSDSRIKEEVDTVLPSMDNDPIAVAKENCLSQSPKVQHTEHAADSNQSNDWCITPHLLRPAPRKVSPQESSVPFDATADLQMEMNLPKNEEEVKYPKTECILPDASGLDEKDILEGKTSPCNQVPQHASAEVQETVAHKVSNTVDENAEDVAYTEYMMSIMSFHTRLDDDLQEENLNDLEDALADTDACILPSKHQDSNHFNHVVDMEPYQKRAPSQSTHNDLKLVVAGEGLDDAAVSTPNAIPSAAQHVVDGAHEEMGTNETSGADIEEIAVIDDKSCALSLSASDDFSFHLQDSPTAKRKAIQLSALPPPVQEQDAESSVPDYDSSFESEYHSNCSAVKSDVCLGDTDAPTREDAVVKASDDSIQKSNELLEEYLGNAAVLLNTTIDIATSKGRSTTLPTGSITHMDVMHFRGELQTAPYNELVSLIANDENAVPVSNESISKLLGIDCSYCNAEDLQALKNYVQFFSQIDALMVKFAAAVSSDVTELHENHDTNFRKAFDDLMQTPLGQAVNEAAYFIYDAEDD